MKNYRLVEVHHFGPLKCKKCGKIKLRSFVKGERTSRSGNTRPYTVFIGCDACAKDVIHRLRGAR